MYWKIILPLIKPVMVTVIIIAGMSIWNEFGTALFLLNFFGSAIGITLGLNWINALVIGVAGFPGLVLLLLIKYLF